MSNGFEFAIGLLNIVLLFLLLRPIVIKPLIQMAKDREANVKRRIEEAQTLFDEAQKQREKYQALLDGVESEKQSLLEHAQREAEAIRARGTEVAEREARELVEKANSESAGARKSVVADVRARMVAEAMARAQELLSAQIDARVHQNVLEKFLGKIGGSHAE